ncbi:MAG: iron donor protein CyaY [Sulfurimicrobium sp.]|nr:iron donor protein CyaY [Sulfurimicrobium sp.]MDO9191230.1 iron donor protein CyaY [Sulfurimicrobium sp.]MDP1897108.1 iron donor protein CyaY [Sulfurimicrobium sp.]MDP2198663.1 iron donor protein CyaY [Sulfurimicrobium sp.]
MTETEFSQLVDATLAKIEQAIEASEADIDFEMTAGILELEFGNGSKIIINRQSATQQLWVAAKSGGYHYLWQDNAWRNTRDGSELFASLGHYVSEQAGEKVELGRYT